MANENKNVHSIIAIRITEEVEKKNHSLVGIEKLVPTSSENKKKSLAGVESLKPQPTPQPQLSTTAPSDKKK